jgi:hypothetical protein
MGKMAGASRNKPEEGKEREKTTFERPSTKAGNSLRRKHSDPEPLREELRPEQRTDLPRANERRMSKL